MCFEPNLIIDKPKRKWGYKAFRVYHDRKLHGEYAGKVRERKRDTWLDEESFRPSEADLVFMTRSSKMGWRVILLKRDMKKWVDLVGWKDLKIVKVKFRNILSVGVCRPEEEIKLPSILAKEIFIPKEQ